MTVVTIGTLSGSQFTHASLTAPNGSYNAINSSLHQRYSGTVCSIEVPDQTATFEALNVSPLDVHTGEQSVQSLLDSWQKTWINVPEFTISDKQDVRICSMLSIRDFDTLGLILHSPFIHLLPGDEMKPVEQQRVYFVTTRNLQAALQEASVEVMTEYVASGFSCSKEEGHLRLKRIDSMRMMHDDFIPIWFRDCVAIMLGLEPAAFSIANPDVYVRRLTQMDWILPDHVTILDF